MSDPSPTLRRSARSTKGIPKAAFGEEEYDSLRQANTKREKSPARARATPVTKKNKSKSSNSKTSNKKKTSKSPSSELSKSFSSSKRKQESSCSSQTPKSTKKEKSLCQIRQEEQDQIWHEMYERCRKYQKKHGHTQIPYRYEKDPELGTWVTTQRRKKSMLSQDRINALDSIWFEWTKKATRGLIRKEHWEDMFARLQAYKEENGDCLVPKGYNKDKHLVKWVTNQRTDYSKGRMDDERKDRLEALGFKWNVYGDRWNEMFDRLKQYKEKHGDCLVPVKWTEDTKLGRWVIDQRHRKFVLSDERIAKLDSVGFTWKAKKWDDMFEKLVEYKLKHGDCMVPQYYKEDLKLGTWVIHQRSRKSALSEDRIERLDAIGFAWRVQRGRKATVETDKQHRASNNGESEEEEGAPPPQSFPPADVTSSSVAVHLPPSVASMPPGINEHEYY